VTDQQAADRVVADARWVLVRVAEQCLAFARYPVESAEALPGGPYPKVARRVLGDAQHITGNAAARNIEVRAPPAGRITPVQCAGGSNP